ncbi:MAG: VOC family protein [Candidatus Dormibacteraceae bacterium]
MNEPRPTRPTLSPYLIVPDADSVIDFLRAAFGAEVESIHRTPAGGVMHAELRIGDSVVMLGSKSPGRQASLHLLVEDVDAAHARALAAGGRSEREPANQDYGSRSAGVCDPGGNIWWLAGPLR